MMVVVGLHSSESFSLSENGLPTSSASQRYNCDPTLVKEWGGIGNLKPKSIGATVTKKNSKGGRAGKCTLPPAVGRDQKVSMKLEFKCQTKDMGLCTRLLGVSI